MDSIPAGLFQNVDNKANDVITDCLRNPVVLREVLKHFPNPELLKLSFVNKLWNHEARSVMRDRGEVMARLRFTDEQPCQRIVEAFGSDLRQMNVVPFSGISIEITPWYHKCSTEAMSPTTFHAILGRLSLKKVSIKLLAEWCQYEGCPGIQLAKKVLQHFSQVLQELSLQLEYEREDFMERVVQECRFPSLKVLKHVFYNDFTADYVNCTKTLVSRAPILQELRFDKPVSSILTLLEGSSAVVVYDCEIRAPFKEILENEINFLRLERMLLIYPDREFNFERFNRITPMLLQKSRTTTLKFMPVDSVLAVPLMTYGVCLKNVNELEIRINHADQRISRIFKGFDFTRIFPNLSKVEISGRGERASEVSSGHINTILEQANAALREPEPMPDRAAKIKELSLSHYSLCNSKVQYFAEMFPTIDKLVLDRSTTDGEIPLWSIWKNWLDLKELEIRGDMIQIHGNLDSVFCGLFPHEVAELRQKDDEYLKKVNIVPVWPGITCLRNLRTLTLNHEDYRTSFNLYGDDALFSKVTVLTAFARCPALAVSLHMSSEAVPPAMTHLKPYVSVRSTLRLRESPKFDYEDWPESYYY